MSGSLLTPREGTATRSERSERRRQRILDAAGESFVRLGFAKTTVEQIAQQAGVSKGLVYHHFGGKEEVLAAVLESTLAEWEVMSETAALSSADSVLDALAGMHRKAIEFARTTPVLRAFFQMDPLVLMGLGQEAVERAMEDFRERLAASLQRGVRNGELRADLDVKRTAAVIHLLHAAFIEAAINPEWSVDVSDAGLIDASMAVLEHGIVRRS